MSSSCRTSLNLLLCLLSSQISLFEMFQIRNSPFTACPCLFLSLFNIFVYYLCLSLFIWSLFIYSCMIMGIYRIYFQVQPYSHISSFFSWLLYVASAWCNGNHRIMEWLRLEGTTGEVIWNLQFVSIWSTVGELFTSSWSRLSSALVAHCLCRLHLAYISLVFWNHTADRQVWFPLICFVNFEN